jgi:hypothetical protein
LTRRAVFLVSAALFAGPPPVAMAQAAPLAVVVGDGAPAIMVGEVLAESTLEDVLRAGVPVRLRFRVELWRDRFFDELVRHAEWVVVVAFEPIDDRFMVGRPGQESLDAFPSLAAAREVIETTYAPALRPDRSGRYYYLASLVVETLSLSDLDELGNWLRGELGPAVEGRRSVAGAFGTGLRRLFIRVLDLPTRRYQARSGHFQFP